jgi:hypothetical protein
MTEDHPKRIQERRHPHPHVDPRQPRQASQTDTNPPVFAFKPGGHRGPYRLAVAKDEVFREIVLDVQDLADPLYLPAKALPAGRYYWKWSTSKAESDVFWFDVTPGAVILEVPPVDDWLRLLPQGHPRLYVCPEDIEPLRASRHGGRAGAWQRLQTQAETVLREPHEMTEPPFLPGWGKDYESTFAVWYKILWESRHFVQAAQLLALAYLGGGDSRFGRAACQRMASISRWDPMGSSHIAHNDEAHMSFMWHGPQACDWAWDPFTEDERARVIEQFRWRGQITYEHVRHKGCYGIDRFDSHSGREIVFLAQLAIVFHEHIPEARQWLGWLRPVLCGIWPIWGRSDGAWAEGISYGLAYVGIMTMFATALKRAVGVDLYRRPFWRNHAAWRQWCHPPYAQWIGFGDHSERWASTWRATADLVELIGLQTGATEFASYVAEMRREADKGPATPSERGEIDLTVRSQLYLLGKHEAPGDAERRPPLDPASPNDGFAVASKPAVPHGVLKVFPDVGWAAIRTDMADPSREVAMIFRSSPYGSTSHSHANHNDFILHVAGQVVAMPSGYYDGYGSPHHMNWVWHTKSHNCLTLSDASQLMASPDAVGGIEHVFEDERLIHFCGNADAPYKLHARMCRRHVLFFKSHACFALIDSFVARPGVRSALQWNIHSWERFDVDCQARTFRLQRGSSRLVGHVLCHQPGFFSLSEGWDPPPMAQRDHSQWFAQYHLRFTVNGHPTHSGLGVLLCPGHSSLQPPAVVTERVDNMETARIGQDLLLVSTGAGVEYDGGESPATAAVRLAGQWYEIYPDGVRRSLLPPPRLP